MTATATAPVRRVAGAPQPARRPGPAARPLALVAPRRRIAPKGPFVLLVAVLLGSGLIGLLLLNTVLAEDAFAVHDLQRQAATLSVQEQALQQRVADLEAPASLAHRAQLLGMVPAGDPVFLRLSDGAVLGDPVPAKAAAVTLGAAVPATP